jgi:tight adherence protein B
MVTVIFLIFMAVFLVALAIFFVFRGLKESPKAHLKRRLRRLQADRDETAGRGSGLLRESGRFQRSIFELPLLSKLSNLIQLSGLSARPSAVVAVLSALSLGGFCVIYLFYSSLVTASIGAIVAPFLLIAYLSHLKQEREKKFAEQLPDVLMMISRSLRAGHSLSSAIELVSQEMPEPTQGLFRTVYDHQQLGMRMADALQTLLHKIRCTDLHYFLTIIRINSESGGNLSEILDKLAETINSRLQVRRQVQVLTAEGRISGYILMLLPIAVFFIFKFKDPAYMSVFFTEPMCEMMLLAAIVAQVIGFLAIRKIVDIKI